MFFERRLSLVTGGTGFIGTHIAKALLEQGGRVRIVAHRRPPIVSDPRVEIVHADLTDQEQAVTALNGADFVFHCAGAVSGLGVSAGSAMAGITTNLNLTAQVLQAAWTAGAERILIFSSSTVYPASDRPIAEDEMESGPPHPSYLGYGYMRRYFERLAEFAASRSKLGVALVRPTAVYGPHDDFNPATSHVIPALVRKAVEKLDPFDVWGTGDEIRDLLHVTDLARGCLLTMEKHAVCDPVNIGYGAGVTVRRAVEIILAAAGHSGATVRFDPSKPTSIPIRLVDTSKAKRLLGFEPAIPIETGLRDLVKWYEQTRRTPP
jgi:GDP-L-fucose synthase